MTALPVAAALRDAYKIYSSYCVPFDHQLGSILVQAVPFHVVSQTRVCVGATPNYTFPGFMNAGYELAGGGHAVTVGNLIIFSRHLDFSECGDWNWLLHEMRHVEQYMSFSNNVMEAIDGFAVRYVGHFDSLEEDAQNAADIWQSVLDRIYGGC